ncbi:DUF1203 domain-containing protein [Methylobacterium pseudosasicola]|uniref:DUF1203 domain-containing protein n=1 Tax=Methylobacterium pseudosasicola TaxID=582667 RepID=A0A1I4T9A2_9HYPH|nr:DUF1203 domain-containing protein [Methylobacterium pseudosasicola]SFM73173.1 Protein of unknown function [Methylobacterium pseudosasicola]
MTRYRCIPIDDAVAERFRRSGRDDFGNPVRRVTAASATGFPCRHCLCCAEPGEPMLLGSYDLGRPRGVYWTPSPIFLHVRSCISFDATDVVAPIIRANSLVSVRAYDAEDLCLYDLGHVCAGAEVDAALLRALEDPRTAFVNVHTARPGCLLSRVERVEATSSAAP